MPCDRADQGVIGRLHTEEAQVRCQVRASEISGEVALEQRFMLKIRYLLPFLIPVFFLMHSLVIWEWTIDPLQAAHPRKSLSIQEEHKQK